MNNESTVPHWTERADCTKGIGTIDNDLQAAALSKRERQVAVLLALGDTCAEIAEQLGVTLKTAASHRRAVLDKLYLRNAVHLARLALRRGWVMP